MNRFDYFSGEPQHGSPGFYGSTNMSTQYVSDPNLRYQQTQPNRQIMPGYTGYNQYPTQQGIQIPNKFSGFAGNPAIEMLQNGGQVPYYLQSPRMQYVQPQYQDRVVHVPGFNPGGDTLYSEDINQIISNLQMEMMVDMEEAIAERNKRFQGYFNNNYGSNYYGMPYYSQQLDYNVLNKYKQKAEEIRQEGYNKRLAFNKNLSRLAHGFIEDGMSEEDINTIYDGYTYTIPAVNQRQDALQEELARMVPVSNQNMYIEHYNQVHKFYQSMIGNSKDMNEFLDLQGLVKTSEIIEEDFHNKRDASQYYQTDAYKRILRKSIMERKGINSNNLTNPNPESQNPFPTLSNCSQLLDDGTLSITAPSWIGNGKQFVIDNEMEQHFEENRHKFLQSIYSQGVT